MLSRKLAALAALSLVAASSAAVAQSAAPSRTTSAPAVAVGESNEGADALEGNTGTYLIVAIVIALTIWGVISISDNSSSP